LAKGRALETRIRRALVIPNYAMTNTAGAAAAGAAGVDPTRTRLGSFARA
jgi:hypothetical protein